MGGGELMQLDSSDVVIIHHGKARRLCDLIDRLDHVDPEAMTEEIGAIIEAQTQDHPTIGQALKEYYDSTQAQARTTSRLARTTRPECVPSCAGGVKR
jgi:hypothetical protein